MSLSIKTILMIKSSYEIIKMNQSIIWLNESMDHLVSFILTLVLPSSTLVFIVLKMHSINFYQLFCGLSQIWITE